MKQTDLPRRLLICITNYVLALTTGKQFPQSDIRKP